MNPIRVAGFDGTFPRALILCVCASAASARLSFSQCPDGTPPPCAGARPPLPVIVITPFENRSRDTADAYLAATLSEDLAAALGRAHAIHLLSPRGSRRGAEYVLAGSVRRAGSAVRVSARLERVGSGEIVWTTTLDRPAARSTEAAEQVARRVLDRLGVRRAATGGGELARPVDPDAWDLYLRGRYHARRRVESGIQQAVGLFRQAVARDSTFALGWAGLAGAMHYAARWRLAIPGVPRDSLVRAILDASERALIADSANAEIWITRADALQDVDPTSRTASVRALRRALALDSLNAGAWTDLGNTLEEAGDSAGALRALRRAVAIDPASLEALTWLSLHFYWGRQYDSAAVWADSEVALDPAYLSARRMAGTVALARGNLAAAEAQFGAARAVGPGSERIWAMAGLAIVAVTRGDSAGARSLIREMETLADTAATNVHSAVFIAWAYTALGDRRQALDWLERYHPSGDLHFRRHLLGDAPLDSLRGEPRFQRLLAETRPPGAR